MKRPRSNTWWRRQEARHTELWQRVADDPGARQVMQTIAADGIDYENEAALDEAWLLALALAVRIREMVPELGHFYGDQLPDAVWRYVAGHLPGVDGRAVAERLAPLYVRGLPDTAITFDGTTAHVPVGTSKGDVLTLIDFQTWYEPTRSMTGKRGRPAGSTSTDAEGQRAYALKERGQTWLDIAEALWGRRPDPDRDVNYEAVRRRVRQRIKLGQRLAATN